MFFLMLAAALPGLFWEQGPETADALKTAGIECIAVPPPNVDAWKRNGFCASGANFSQFQKSPSPGVELRPDIATATRAPWVNSNGARLLRSAGKNVYYDAAKGKADICAAEAFVYGAEALVRAEPADLEQFASMLRFLKRVGAAPLPVRANIGFIDDGSAEAGEIMNLLIRRNLLFRIVSAPDPELDLNVRLGAPEFPRSAAANPSEFAATIRRKLTDEKRLLRIYGSEVVIGRLTGDGSRARLHLLNYGGRKVDGLRVRVLGLYKQAQLSAPDGAGAADVLAGEGAIEFSIPALASYAVVDLK